MSVAGNGNDVFDPYHKWLGIPPGEQPPNHYRLLGIALFEPDSDVIANAADQRMAYIRTFQTGPNAAISQNILNQVAAAKVCLLNPERKREYDAYLRGQMASVGFPPQAVTTIPPVSTVTPPPDPPAAISISTPILPPSQGVETAFTVPPPVAETLPPLVSIPPQSIKQAGDYRHRRFRMSWSHIGAVALTIVVVVVVAVMLMPQDRNITSRNAPSEGNDTAQDGTEVPDDGGTNDSAETTDGGGTTGGTDASTDGVTPPMTPEETNKDDPIPTTELSPEQSPPISSSTETESTSKGNARISDFTGTWTVRYSDRHTRTYTIASDGSTFYHEANRQGKLFAKDGDVLLDFRDGRLERFELIDSKLRIEHFNPATRYPDGRPILGVGEWQPDSDPARLPIPDQASQDKARAQAEELFGPAHTKAKGSPERLSQLAAQMIQRAMETQGTEPQDAANRYVVLDYAREISVEAGDITLAMQAIDRLSERFAIDSLKPKGETVKAMVGLPLSPEQIYTLLESLNPLIEASLAEDDFALAKIFATSAITLARRLRDGDIVKRAVERDREIEERERMYLNDIVPAKKILEQDSDDPAANWIVGKYTCFVKSDWLSGLPFLARGKDAGIRELAKKEVAGLSDPREKLKVADGWWELAKKYEENKRKIQIHAADLYQQVLPWLSGIDKERAEKRIKEVEAEGGNDGDGTVVKRIRFSSPESLKAFLPINNAPVTVRKGIVVLGDNTGTRRVPLVYNGYFEEIKSVRIVGGIFPPGKFNFRMSVGPVGMILNWENADENHFRCVDAGRSEVVRPRVLVPGKFHEIVVQQDGDKAVVSVDGKPLYTCVTKLNGAISIYTYKSAIAIREIVVEGKVDPNKKVTGPSHNNIF